MILPPRTIQMTEELREQRRTNVKKIAARKKAATKCKRGHDLTPDNIYTRKNGTRNCLTCKKDRDWYRKRGLKLI